MDEPGPVGVGEKADQVTSERAEVLKEERDKPVTVDERISKEETLIRKYIRRIVARNGSVEIRRGDEVEVVYDVDKAEEFLTVLESIGLDDIRFEAVDGADSGHQTNLSVGDDTMSTAWEGSLPVAVADKDKYRFEIRRVRLYNLGARVSAWLGDDIPWDEDVSDRSMTVDKLKRSVNAEREG